MELVSLKELDTKCIYQKKGEYPTQSYVILNGLKTITVISWIVLEKCVRIYDYYLVFMTYDCPFEEMLTFSLIR